MIYNLSWIGLSILPIILFGSYVYFKDKNKEPKKLLLKLFIGGILAAILTLVIDILLSILFPRFLNSDSFTSSFELIIYAFLVIGLIEEISKWIFLYLFSYNNKEFDQLYDMIVYSVFIALGFALVENILYVYDGGIDVAIGRFFLAIPGHVSIAIFMGYYLSLAKLSTLNNINNLKNRYLILSIIVPIILHGIYDYCILASNFFLLIIFFVFILILFYKANQKLIFMSKLKIKL